MKASLLLSVVALAVLSSHGAARPTPRKTQMIKPDIEVADADSRIFVYHHFLSDDECDYLRAKAEKRLERSGVVNAEAGGGSEVSDIRTSDGMFFSRAEDEIIENIERRLAQWTLTPVHNGEGLQVLRYKLDQKYDAHWDYFFDEQNIKNGGNRYATVLMYLAAAEEGGETVFPKVPGHNPQFSACAQGSMAVKPRKGDAILFHSLNVTDGSLEDRSMHGACPVLKGEKWSMTKWIHSGWYRMGDKYDEEHSAYLERLEEMKATASREL